MQILQMIDWLVAAAGIVTAAFFVLRCLRPGDSLTLLNSFPARPNRFGEDSVLIAVLAYLLTAAVFAAILEPNEPEAAVWKVLAVDSAARIAGVVACMALASRRFEGGAGGFLLGSARISTAKLVLLTAGAALVTLGVCPLIQAWGIWAVQQIVPDFAPKAHPTLERLSQGQPELVIGWLWMSAGVVAPVAEEVFFRGVLQSALAGALRNRWLAIVLAAAAFGAVHLTQPQAVLPLIAMGLVLGYLYERTGTLAAPIAVHVLFNLKTLVWHLLLRA
jgi:membrane protease YdiL (CAAX protease family)